MDVKQKEKRVWRILFVSLLIILAFFLGRSFGFREACELYDPVVKKSQDLISDLQSQIEQYQQESYIDDSRVDNYDFRV